MPRVALVTATVARDHDDDLLPLRAALRSLGLDADDLAWDEPCAWADYDAAVIRSTWDYHRHHDRFLTWVDHVAEQTSLFNPAPVVRWNTDKRYLADLAAGGIPVVPTVFLDPGEAGASPSQAQIESALDEAAAAGRATDPGDAPGDETSDVVVKPAVSAGSRATARHHRRGPAGREVAAAHVRELLSQGRRVMIQPYLDRIDQLGESALVFVDGQLSHGLRKGPLLRPGAGPDDDGLFAPEQITARRPDPDEVAVAEAAVELAAQRTDGPLLYARVDLVRDQDDQPVVLELELTEPSLFFDRVPDSVHRLAHAIAERVR